MRLWLHEYPPLSLSIQIWGHNVTMNSLVGSQMSPDLIEIKKQILIQLKQLVYPEFIKRIDDNIMFLPISQEGIR